MQGNFQGQRDRGYEDRDRRPQPQASGFEREVFANYGQSLTEAGIAKVKAIVVDGDPRVRDEVAEGFAEFMAGRRFSNAQMGHLRGEIQRMERRKPRKPSADSALNFKSKLAVLGKRHENIGGTYIRTLFTAAITAIVETDEGLEKRLENFCAFFQAFMNYMYALA